jgi:hypothetical protein
LWPGLTRFGAGGPVCPWVFDDFVRICSEIAKSMKDPRADWPSCSKSSTSGRFCFWSNLSNSLGLEKGHFWKFEQKDLESQNPFLGHATSRDARARLVTDVLCAPNAARRTTSTGRSGARVRHLKLTSLTCSPPMDAYAPCGGQMGTTG